MSDVLNGIIDIKRKISVAIDMDVAFITDAFVDGNEIVFNVLETEQFAAEWKNDDIVDGTVQHIKSYQPLEEIWF